MTEHVGIEIEGQPGYVVEMYWEKFQLLGLDCYLETKYILYVPKGKETAVIAAIATWENDE